MTSLNQVIISNNFFHIGHPAYIHKQMAMTCKFQPFPAANYSYSNFPTVTMKVLSTLTTSHVGCPRSCSGCSKTKICAVVNHNVQMVLPDNNSQLASVRKSSWSSSILMEEKDERKTIGLGKFGKYGGKYVPETIISCLSKLELELNSVIRDPEFQMELATILRDYVGRETPLYLAQRLTDYYKNKDGEGPEIYLKREDLNHTGAHKINNAVGQVMLAKRMGRKSVVVATGAGQHGVATAAACARFSLECTIYMGSIDIEKQSSNVLQMKLHGAQFKGVQGTFKDATSEAIRHWVNNLDDSFYLSGTVMGPHPGPSMVREFQSVIGKETRRQAMEKWGGKPDVLLACVGSGSNAMGLFSDFLKDKDVRLIGIEGAGFGLESGKHSATLAKGELGVYHGAMSYLLQDKEGQILRPHSIGTGLEYPGVGPELSFLKDTTRAEFYCVTDEEAVDAYQKLCRLEGILPALESSHTLAFLEKLCPTLPNGAKVVVNCSGRGEKDLARVFEITRGLTAN